MAAAKFVLATDEQAEEDLIHLQHKLADFGVTATLKPHQIEGVAWLIRRYIAGVNVILGIHPSFKLSIC